MRKPNYAELSAIEEITYQFLPNLWEVIIDKPNARLPTIIPETLGMFAAQAIFYALQCDDASIRREVAAELWNALPDRPEIHNYEGFHVLCDLLDRHVDEAF